MRWFEQHGRQDLASHSLRVSVIAVELAERFGLSSEDAKTAAILHDVARVLPTGNMVDIARRGGLYVYPEEASLPDLLHQRLSAEVASSVFAVDKDIILQAIGCHTTLRAGHSELDVLLLLADKLSWDRTAHAPFAVELESRLPQGLEAAAAVYLAWIWQERTNMKSIHPWLKDAYAHICGKLWEAE